MTIFNDVTVILKIKCENVAAVNYAMSTITEMMMKQKLENWKMEMIPHE